MKIDELKKLFISEQTESLEFLGKCHDCQQESQVLATITDDGIAISGGAVYKPFADETFYIKCESCYKKDNILRDYQPCDIYSRVVGYMRPVGAWNEAKQQEFHKRKNFKLEHQEF